jgi:hypothetical protein
MRASAAAPALMMGWCQRAPRPRSPVTTFIGVVSSWCTRLHRRLRLKTYWCKAIVLVPLPPLWRPILPCAPRADGSPVRPSPWCCGSWTCIQIDCMKAFSYSRLKHWGVRGRARSPSSPAHKPKVKDLFPLGSGQHLRSELQDRSPAPIGFPQ